MTIQALRYLKDFSRSVIFFMLSALLVWSFVGPRITYAATTPSLGAATSYGILASTYTNTSASTVNGDVGFTTPPAVPPLGAHPNYGSGAPYATAGADQGTALTNLNGQACTTNFPPGAVVITGTYTPGVYCSSGAMNASGTITLDGAGTYIFRADGALNTAAGTLVTTSNGASACDVFWTPIATTLGANTTFVGTVIDDAAITVGANTNWTGRALSFASTVTTDTTTITVPTCAPPPATLRVVKNVTNNNGGTAVAANFTTHVTLSGIDVAGSPAAGAGPPGTTYSLAPGTYVVSEDANASYAHTFSGDCDIGGNVTLASNDDKTCTITNDDRTASINVVKLVINDSGRTNTIGDFPLFVGGTPVTSGATTIFAPGSYAVTETTDPDYTQAFSGDCDTNGNITIIPGDNTFCIITNDDIAAPVVVPPVPPLISVVKVPNPLVLPSGPGTATYTFTLTNVGTVTVTNITMTDDSCNPVTLVSGDTNANAQLEINETWTYTCDATVSQTHTNNVVATGWANGIIATDIASATVVVGSAAVPPLIHVTKIPDPLTLPVGGGTVTYILKVTNPGTVPLTQINLTDDMCAPLNFISGDGNNNSQLDTAETWTYTCSASLTKTTVNTAIASGAANGLTARDFAISTVVVGAVPGLPNTGSRPDAPLP